MALVSFARPNALNGPPRIQWPDGKRFAFTIVDDTDEARMDNVPPVYAFLQDHGFRTTKTVWALNHADADGLSCDDAGYLDWLHSLQEAGFEIAWHGAAGGSSSREEIIRGLERFTDLFGHGPTVMSNHTDCRDGIYWGYDRMTGTRRLVYDLLTFYSRHGFSRGHVEGDRHFWGDLCRRWIKYVRNFVFADINTLKACPVMPYHDPLRPYVNSWFASSDGATVVSFNRCLAEAAQDRLEEEGGACIMYTHLAFEFHGPRGLNPTFCYLMERLSRRPGWFVPASTLLDYLQTARGHHEITDRERGTLERQWLWNKVRGGPS